MTDQGSYHVSSFSASQQAEIRRLDAQVDLFWSSERELLREFGLHNARDYLDCGCGPGRLIEVVKSAWPSVRCSGLEMDPILVDAAAAKMQSRGFYDCRITQGTAEEPGLPEESYDFITMRLVLEHVPDPVAALQSLKRLLRPGGRLFIVSNDFEYHTRTWPPVPELEDLYRAYCASRRKDGGDPCIGRRVPLLLKRAGFRLLGQRVEVAHNTLLGDEAFLKAEGVGIPAQLVSTGFLPQAVFESLIRNWKTMLAQPEHAIMRQLFVAVGERPSTDPEPGTANGRHAAATPAPAVRSSPVIRAPGSLEEKIANLWCRAMHVDRVEPHRNFFDLGGDSLMLEEVHSGLRDLGFDVQITTLFQFPTVASLAEHLAGPGTTSASAPAPITPPPNEAPVSSGDDVLALARRRREALARRKRPGAS